MFKDYILNSRKPINIENWEVYLSKFSGFSDGLKSQKQQIYLVKVSDQNKIEFQIILEADKLEN